MIELALNKLQKYYGATMVLEDVSFEVMTGDRIGIVGDNGCGKTTLFKIIMGIEGYDKGQLTIRKGATLAYLEQMPEYPESYKAIDVLREAFKELYEIEASMKHLERKMAEATPADAEALLTDYSRLQLAFERLDGYDKDEKLSKVCTGLRLSDEFIEQNFSTLSGGEKTTVNLGRILLESPDILLLDEPSNHLDFYAMEWLEDYLKEYKGTVLIVSHDRYFLDQVATRIIEIEDMVSSSYQGNYSAYVEEKDRRLKEQLEDYENQQKRIKDMEKAIARLKDWGQRVDNPKFFRRAFSMQKMLDKMERVDRPLLDRRSIAINMESGERSGNQVIIVESLCKSYEGRVIIDNADLLVRHGEAVSLIGGNGCGKSTLIKLLLGIESQESGTAVLGSSVQLAYLPQNVSFDAEDKTVLDTFREDISITEGKAREYLARYMFFGEDVFKKVGGLSGGERSRLKLAIVMYQPVNLLILDEPTNHLDISSREELEEVLKGFNGTVLFVSHDRQFINNIATRVVELKEGKLISYDGNYEYYKKKSSELKASMQQKSTACDRQKITTSRASDVPVASKNNPWIKASLEEEIKQAELELKAIEKELESPSDDYESINILYEKKIFLEGELERHMEEYFAI